MARAFVVAAVALLGVAATTSTLSSGVDATPNEKVTICHATSSNTNPYTVNRVDESSIDEQNNQYLNGHGDHLGPIFPAPNWGDIIPAFRDFPGYNWTDAGRAIWNNGCVPPPVVEQVTPMEPTLVDPTCDAPGDVTINPVTGVVYTETVNDDGSITVTATADEGYVLTDGATTTWTYTQEQLAQLPDDHEECVMPTLDEATPVAPTLVDPTCDAPGDVTINPVTGVVYTETVNDDGSITVTATADEGYVLTDGATTTWTYTQEQLAQLPDDHEECVASLPPTVVPPGEPTATEPTVGTDTEPTVGTDTEPTVGTDTEPTVGTETEPTVGSMPTGGGAAEAAAVPAAPTTLPNTGSQTWTIFLIGLASLLTGAGLHRLSRRSA